MPQKLKILLDGRSNARVREFEFGIGEVPVSSRSAKGITVTKWAVKEVKALDEKD